MSMNAKLREILEGEREVVKELLHEARWDVLEYERELIWIEDAIQNLDEDEEK